MSVRERCSNHGGQKVKGDFRANLFSIFVDNLNPAVDSATLWGVFKVFGRVRDVFVSTKLGFRKSGFAFIRFDSLEEAILIAKKANGMHLFGWPILSKVANFGWSKRRSLSYGRKSQTFDDRMGREGIRGEGFQNGSFADVIRRNQKGIRCRVVRKEEEMLTMKWSSQEIDHVWIKRCAVGILKQFSNVSSVNQRLRYRGFKFSSAYIGDKCILWCFDSEVEKDGFMRSRFFWADHFSSVVNWSESLLPQARAVWINVRGVPLCYWDTKLFMKLGWMIGEPLLVDEETSSRNRFDRGRILVLLPYNHHCCCDIKVVLEAGSFVVKLKEDDMEVDLLWLESFLGLQKEMSVGQRYANGGRVVVAKSGCVGAAEMRVADVSVGMFDLGSNGLNGEVDGSCDGKVDEPSVKGKASTIGCLVRKDSKLVLQKSESLGSVVFKEKGCLGSQNSESTCNSVIKESNEVSKIGKGRVVKTSCGRGVCTKVRVGGLAESGDGTVLGGKAVLGGGSCDGKGGKGIVKGGVSGKSIRVFGSNDGSSGGVAVSGDQVVYINFEKGRGLLGSGLSPVGSDLGGPAIDLFVDLGDLEPLFRKEKVGEIVASPCPSNRRWGKKNFFPSRIHGMKTRSGARGCNLDGVEEELVDRIARGKEDDKG